MLDILVGQFLKSSDGSGLLKDLQAKGLTEGQATQAVTATAEGAVAQGDGAAAAPSAFGGLGSLMGMLGGGGPSAGPEAGGLGALMGMLGGAPAAPAAAAGGAAPVNPIAQLVAQKTGLSPAIAQMVVAAALPKLLALLGGAQAPAASENKANPMDPTSLFR